MASKAVSDAVAAYLAANFDTCPVTGVNDQMEPMPDGGVFVQVQFPFATEEQMSVGSPGAHRLREEGAIRFVVIAPMASGTDASLTIADELRALFRFARMGDVRTYEANPPVTGDDNDRSGSFVTSFAVAYDLEYTL